MRFCLLISVAVALAGCVTTNPPPSPALQISHSGEVPAYLAEVPSCALVVGGPGSSFADPKIGKVWYEANRQIIGYLYQLLSGEGYQVKRLMLEPDLSSSNVLSSVALALAQSKCNTFIQVALDVDEDKQGKYFQYSVSVIHVAAKKENPRGPSGTNVTTIGDYNRNYRYPRTVYQLEKFYTGDFANRAFDDLKASGALSRIKRGN